MTTKLAAPVLTVALAGAFAAAGPDAAPPPRENPRFPAGHKLEGLPRSDAPVPTYSCDPGHWLNELHALLFTQTLVAEEVGGRLPAERAGRSDAEFFKKGWQFEKRKGTDADRTAFGGDVRVPAVIAVDADRRKRLLAALDRVSTAEKVAAVPELADPLARLLVQWDVAALWWRLEADRKWKLDDPELLTAMAQAVRALAQPRKTLEGLPAGTSDLLAQFAGRDAPKTAAEPYLPPALLKPAEKSGWVEVDRKASKLFRGDVALRASKVYLDAGGRDKSVKLVESVGRVVRPDVPPGAEVALVMTLLGFDPELNPVATPVVDEVRVRRLTGPFRLAPDNPTSSKDGVDHWIYFRSRPGSVLGGEAFRFLPDTTQGLFLEYGSAKHTTFAGQCALCHRTDVNTPTLPMGVSVLNPNAKPKVADDPAARSRVTEEEAKPVGERLRARLGP